MSERDEELQRVAAIAAAEVVRITSSAQQHVQSAATVAAESMRKDIEYIAQDVRDIKKKLDVHYVSVEQFEPIKRIVYGVVAIFGVSIVGAIVALILRQP